MRILRISFALAVLAGSLTACSPATLPLLAMSVSDGQPVALVVACSAESITLRVRPQSAAATGSATASVDAVAGNSEERWEVWNTTPPRVAEVPVFTAPEGWTAQRATLTRLSEGVEYELDAYGTGALRVYPLEFTLADLERIGSGQVLAATGHEAEVLDRSAFLEKAEQECAEHY